MYVGLQSTIRQSMEESLIQILSPKRRIDILRDVMQASEKGDPYIITFCGVNGVGKSTNLAKVSGAELVPDSVNSLHIECDNCVLTYIPPVC